MKTKMRFLILIFTLPLDVFSLMIILFIRIFWGEKLHRIGLILQCEFKKDSFPMRTFYKNYAGTCFGHSIVYKPGGSKNKRVVRHEQHHAEQAEAACVAFFVVALFAFFFDFPLILCFIFWVSGAPLLYVSASLTAIIRGEDPYMGNVLEEGAYALQKKDV